MPTRLLRSRAQAKQFSPLSVQGCKLWLDAGRLGYPAGDGDPVPGWLDQSPSHNDLIQATSSKRAIYKTGLRNGRPLLRFDGVDDWYATTSLGTLAQPNTIFLVARQSGGGSSGAILDGIGTSNRHQFAIFGSKWDMYAGTADAQSGTADTNWHVFTIVFNGASSVFRIDGVLQGLSANPGTQSLTGMTIGVVQELGSPFTGDISELILYNANVAAGDRDTIESYLKRKWGI